jgi:hypothetical protein
LRALRNLFVAKSFDDRRRYSSLLSASVKLRLNRRSPPCRSTSPALHVNADHRRFRGRRPVGARWGAMLLPGCHAPCRMQSQCGFAARSMSYFPSEACIVLDSAPVCSGVLRACSGVQKLSTVATPKRLGWVPPIGVISCVHETCPAGYFPPFNDRKYLEHSCGSFGMNGHCVAILPGAGLCSSCSRFPFAATGQLQARALQSSSCQLL